MTPVLLDAGCIVSYLDRRQQYHQKCFAAMNALTEPPITFTESCHLLRHIEGAADAILEDVRKGMYRLPYLLSARAAEVAKLMRKYADVPMDLADACLVDLATQVGSGRILTLDGDFNVYRWGNNRAFEIIIDLD